MPGTVKRGIGLALGGGAVRGIAHIAVLDVLEREGVPIHAIAGTSVGSIIGALYTAGMPLSEIKHTILKTNWRDILRLTIPLSGLISSDGIYRFMEKILPVKDFSELLIPFAAVATDLRTGEKASLTSGSVARAVQASCSLPFIFTPTEIDNKVFVDGGVSSQVPVTTVREELGAGTVIAVNVNYQAAGIARFDNLVKIAAHLSMLWSSRNARAEEKLADVLVQVNSAGISLYDMSKSKEILRRGEKAVEEKLDEIRALI